MLRLLHTYMIATSFTDLGVACDEGCSVVITQLNRERNGGPHKAFLLDGTDNPPTINVYSPELIIPEEERELDHGMISPPSPAPTAPPEFNSALNYTALDWQALADSWIANNALRVSATSIQEENDE